MLSTGCVAAANFPAHLSAARQGKRRRARGCCLILTAAVRVGASTSRWLAPHLLGELGRRRSIALRSAVRGERIRLANAKRLRREENESAGNGSAQAHTARPVRTSCHVPKARRASHRSSCQQAGRRTTPRRHQTPLPQGQDSTMRRTSGRKRSPHVLRGARCAWHSLRQPGMSLAVGSLYRRRIPGRACPFVAREPGLYKRTQENGGSAVVLPSELSAQSSG
jgi:hypothetical protein